MSDLTNRLRKGFDFLCREKQIDSYQAISNEAANRIDKLEARLKAEESKAALRHKSQQNKIDGLKAQNNFKSSRIYWLS
jgi:hypothetical protein